MSDSIRPGVAVRQGGKEELRASFLKTYVLRLRAEKGDAATEQILTETGIDPSLIDNETGWLSAQSGRRALKTIAGVLGIDALRRRGEWVTSPEALGTHVRMLRGAREPLDAYVYLAANAKELTRVGTWELIEGSKGEAASKDAAPRGAKGAPKTATPGTRTVRMVYRPRSEPGEEPEKPDPKGEALFCAAREGELSGYPRIWGLPDADVKHETCLARGADSCTYVVSWGVAKTTRGSLGGAIASALVVGGAVTALGNWHAGALAAVLGGALGGVGGNLWDKSKASDGARVFEKNRIAALERGLELKGETGMGAALPGELSGTVLGGKYRIGKKIGSGGIGVVYVAEHIALGNEVAVKVLRGAAARDGGEIARLRREAHIQAEIEHPNVARVMDLDQMPDGSMYVVMERLVGRSLADKLAREGVITPGFAIPVFIGVCRALAAAHKKAVVHRDLKPGNIFLCEDGTAKVLDFGMSKLTTAESLTQQGYTLGTPEYMAPEQCIGANVEPRTDVYAFGVLMYEALTGELPINSPNRRELLDLHQRQVPMSMRQRRPDLNLPEALDQIIMMCLKKRINDRPKSASDVEERLAAISLEGLPLSYGPGRGRRVAIKPRSDPPPKDVAPNPAPKTAEETLPKMESEPPKTKPAPEEA